MENRKKLDPRKLRGKGGWMILFALIFFALPIAFLVLYLLKILPQFLEGKLWGFFAVFGGCWLLAAILFLCGKGARKKADRLQFYGDLLSYLRGDIPKGAKLQRDGGYYTFAHGFIVVPEVISGDFARIAGVAGVNQRKAVSEMRRLIEDGFLRDCELDTESGRLEVKPPRPEPEPPKPEKL